MEQLLPGLIGGMIQRTYIDGHFGEKGQIDERLSIECTEKFTYALNKITKICLAEKDDDNAPVSVLMLRIYGSRY